jgi:CheY-like chemotaxis protein
MRTIGFQERSPDRSRGIRFVANPFEGLTALVVEDDILVRADIAEFLRQKGWSVLETAIGAGGLRLIRRADRLHLS